MERRYFIYGVFLDEIYSHAKEILATMTTTLTGKEAGLVGYWTFEGQAEKVMDTTGNGHDGKLIGDAKPIVGPLPTPDQMYQQYLQSSRLGISVQRRQSSQFTDILSITV
ncbi:hypothetical protein FJZ31_33745 [Candidatus Poribacteria bacterium]|nr:hypothetical protein [Candidatus Poribacteria bacterium]